MRTNQLLIINIWVQVQHASKELERLFDDVMSRKHGESQNSSLFSHQGVQNIADLVKL